METDVSVMASTDPNSNTVNLKRTIGLGTAVSLIVGGIIGSGIFVSPQGVTVGAGSYGLSLILWAVCALISMCGALVYVEIGTLIPKSGSAYYVLREVYGDLVGFLYMFTWVLFILPGGVAIVGLTCSEYIMALVFTDGCGAAPENIRQTLAATLLIFVGAVNVQSVRVSGKMAVVCTIGKVLALGIIIIGGMVKLGQGYTEYLDPQNSFEGTSTSVGGIALALLSGLWAFAGWDSLNFFTEEMQNPYRTLPLAIYISMPLISIVYILANISYFTVLSPEELVESPAVAVSWAAYVMPNVAWFVPLSVAVSTFGACSSYMLLNPRLVYVAAREGHMMSVLSMVQVNNLTPAPSVIFLAFFSVLYVYLGTISQLIGYTGTVGWFFQGLVGLATIIMRFTHKNAYRPYKVPLICPVFLILSSLLLTFGPIIGAPELGYLFAVAVLVVGAIVWLVFVRFKVRIPGFDNVTKVLQIFMKVIPPETGIPHPSSDSTSVRHVDRKISPANQTSPSLSNGEASNKDMNYQTFPKKDVSTL